MGSTTHGLPWPAGTELVRDGDNAMRSLAESADDRGVTGKMAAFRLKRAALIGSGTTGWEIILESADSDAYAWGADYIAPKERGLYTISMVVMATGGGNPVFRLDYDQVGGWPIASAITPNVACGIAPFNANQRVYPMFYGTANVSDIDGRIVMGRVGLR